MGRVRRGGYVFVTWAGDHVPRHVHVFRKGRLVLKWDLEKRTALYGVPDRRILRLLDELESEGRI